MISLLIKKIPIPVTETYFSDSHPEFFGIHHMIQSPGYCPGSKSYFTIENDLTTFSQKEVHKDITYEVGRAIREGITSQFVDRSILLDKNKLEELAQEIFNFLNSKKVFSKKKIIFKRLQVAACLDSLAISFSSFQEKNLTCHVYLLDKQLKKVRLLHSISYEGKSKSFIGWANRFHHISDFEYFKSSGFEIYDFGGVSSNDPEKFNGIDKFKLSFGGKITETYSSVVYHFFKFFSGNKNG